MALNYGSEWLEPVPPFVTTIPFQENLENGATLTKHRDTYSFIDPYRFQNKLKGKVVLITQAHRGVGRSTAFAFAREQFHDFSFPYDLRHIAGPTRDSLCF